MSSSGNEHDLIVSVSLTKEITTSQTSNGFEAFLLTIQAFDADDAPASVFVFQREVINEWESDPDVRDKSFFSNVASPNDWQELPVGVPSDEDVVLFLYHKIEVFARSLVEAEYIWSEVQKDVRALVQHHKYMLNVVDSDPDETVVID